MTAPYVGFTDWMTSAGKSHRAQRYWLPFATSYTRLASPTARGVCGLGFSVQHPAQPRAGMVRSRVVAFSHSLWKLLDQIPYRLTNIHSVTLFRGQPQNSRCCQRPVCTIPWRDLRPTLAGCVPVPLAPNLVHCSPDGVSLGCGECTEISDIRSLVANTHLCTSIVQ